MTETVYINGEFVPRDEAAIDIEDRGYQFADAVYEVIYFSDGDPFRLEPHLDRLRRSASELEISLPDLEQLKRNMFELQKRNNQEDANSKLYLQISRGTQERHHAYDDGLAPNVVMTISTFEGHPDRHYREGVKAITVPDDRWARCYIKTTALISNGMAKTKAKREDAFEAIFVRNGFITEGTTSNIFIVKGERVLTPPASNYILNGITRQAVIELVEKSRFQMVERGISIDEFLEADEVFLTGTTTEVMPVTRVGDKIISDGNPGEVTRTLNERYQSLLDD